MPWARFDDRFPSNRKVRPLSDAAFRLYVSSVCWSAENLTDGVVQAKELRLVADVKAARTRAQELVDHGLWEELPEGGWRIHDYHEYNPTAEQVRADRAAKSARQQRWRNKSKGDGTPPEPPADDCDVDAPTDASHDASRDGTGDAAPRARVPGPSRPDPNLTNGEGRERSDGRDARAHKPALSLIPQDWQPAEEDFAAARANIDRLGPSTAQEATAKFIRHHQAKATTAANWGPLWVTWLANERGSLPTLTAVRNPAASHTPTPAKPPHCGNPDCDPVTRTRDAEAENGLRYSVRCPDCHPAKESAA